MGNSISGSPDADPSSRPVAQTTYIPTYPVGEAETRVVVWVPVVEIAATRAVEKKLMPPHKLRLQVWPQALSSWTSYRHGSRER